MRNLIIYCLLLLTAFQSCTKIDCRVRNMDVVLNSYDSAERSLIIVKQYNVGNGFSESSLINTDTFHSNYSIRIEAFIDYEIIIPIAGDTYKITEIEVTNKTGKIPLGSGGSEKCFTGAKCRINGAQQESRDAQFTINKNH